MWSAQTIDNIIFGLNEYIAHDFVFGHCTFGNIIFCPLIFGSLDTSYLKGLDNGILWF